MVGGSQVGQAVIRHGTTQHPDTYKDLCIHCLREKVADLNREVWDRGDTVKALITRLEELELSIAQQRETIEEWRRFHDNYKTIHQNRRSR